MNFIEFNNKKIWYFRKDGEILILVKSVCEALNVDFERQRKRINDDPILGPAPSNQTVQVPGEKQKRQYFCLPERYVYGWIFSIQSNSDELIEYKKECYNVLYSHFHKIITRQTAIYKEMTASKKIITDFEIKISAIEGYEDYVNAKMRYARLWKQVKETTADPELFDENDFSLK